MFFRLPYLSACLAVWAESQVVSGRGQENTAGWFDNYGVGEYTFVAISW